MQPHRFVQQRLNPFFEVLRGMLEVEVIPDLPVPPGLDRSVLRDQHMAGSQFGDVLIQSPARQTKLEGDIFFEPLQVGPNVRQERQQRLDFRREVERVADRRYSRRA